MSATGQKTEARGVYTPDLPIADRARIRIDPQLISEKGEVLKPDYAVVTEASSGLAYNLDWISRNMDGTFDWQNNTGQELSSVEWYARAAPMLFVAQQTDLGPNGANPSPAASAGGSKFHTSYGAMPHSLWQPIVAINPTSLANGIGPRKEPLSVGNRVTPGQNLPSIVPAPTSLSLPYENVIELPPDSQIFPATRYREQHQFFTYPGVSVIFRAIFPSALSSGDMYFMLRTDASDYPPPGFGWAIGQTQYYQWDGALRVVGANHNGAIFDDDVHTFCFIQTGVNQTHPLYFTNTLNLWVDGNLWGSAPAAPPGPNALHTNSYYMYMRNASHPIQIVDYAAYNYILPRDLILAYASGEKIDEAGLSS